MKQTSVVLVSLEFRITAVYNGMILFYFIVIQTSVANGGDARPYVGIIIRVV